MVAIISFFFPYNYRGEGEINKPVLPAPDIVNLIGNIDHSKKIKIFTNTPGAIKSVSVSLPEKYPDKVKIIVDTKTSDILPQAFKDIVDYISNLPEIKEEIARLNEETDFKIKKLIEARKANLIFLNQMIDMIGKRHLQFINFNPSDLIKKDTELSLEIMNLQKAKTDMMMKKELNVKVTVGKLGTLSITKQPSNSQIKLIIIFTGLLSFFTGIFVVFFLEYIDRIKARENK